MTEERGRRPSGGSRGVVPPGQHCGALLASLLAEHGVRHVFGIPGDYVLGFYDQLSKSKLAVINTCDEQGAGFAAPGPTVASQTPARPVTLA